MSRLEVESSDVIKLIIQFLKENGLLHTLRALQEESQVTLNTVDDVERFTMDIIHGKWDQVLEVVSTLRLAAHKLTELFEQMVLELAELRELDTARALLRNTPAMHALKKEDPNRYLRLEHILQRTYFDYSEAYPGGTNKERRRQQIAQSLKKEVFVVPPSRLLALLSQSLRWQQHTGLLPKGSKYDLFRGTAPREVLEEEKPPAKNVKAIKFSKKSHPEVAAFSPDGQYLVSGSSDGFVEVWDFDSGKLCKDLKYQAEDDLMLHEEAVSSLAFSRDSEHLASASNKGVIKVWKLRTGQCVRKFPSAHTAGVTSLEFARDATQLLSGSFDQTVRIHGLKSGRTLKEFRGHKSYVTSAVYTEDATQVISASSDGDIKVWDAKTTDNLHTFKPTAGASVSIIGATFLSKSMERLVVCTRSPSLFLMSTSGEVIQTFTLGQGGGDMCAYTPSPKGNFMYAVGDSDKVLYCFNGETAKIEHILKLHKKDVLGITHHPHRNVLASWSDDGTLKIWRP